MLETNPLGDREDDPPSWSPPEVTEVLRSAPSASPSAVASVWLASFLKVDLIRLETNPTPFPAAEDDEAKGDKEGKEKFTTHQ